MRRAIYSISALVVMLVLVGYEMRVETDKQEVQLKQQMATICPKFWENVELAKQRGVYEQALQVCPEA